MRAHRAIYPIATMCRVLEVSTSGYYAWRDREPSARRRQDEELSERIRRFHARSDGTYGSPRILADLQESGERVGRKRVARLMQAEGLEGVSRRKKSRTTKRDASSRPAPDLVDRNFTAEGPDRLWVADITYVPTWAGFLYLAVVLDAWSRRVVGWAMATHLRTDLVLDALEMALVQRRPSDVVHHSDQGCQYTSLAFGRLASRQAYGRRWARSGTVSTTPCARASSPPWSASGSIAEPTVPATKPDGICSPSSRAGTTRTGATPPSARSARPNSSGDTAPASRHTRRAHAQRRPRLAFP